MEKNRRLAPDALGRCIRLEGGHVDDREVRREALEILERRPAEEVAREEAGPRGLRRDAQRAPVLWMGADVQVLAVDRPIGDVFEEPRAEAVVVLLADRLVDG